MFGLSCIACDIFIRGYDSVMVGMFAVARFLNRGLGNRTTGQVDNRTTSEPFKHSNPWTCVYYLKHCWL